MATETRPVEETPLNITQKPDYVNPYFRLKNGLATRKTELNTAYLLPLELSNLLPTLDHVDYSKIVDQPQKNPFHDPEMSGPHLNPLANMLSRPMYGRIVPGSVDTSKYVGKITDQYGRSVRKIQHESPISQPEIPGVKGSGKKGLEMRNKKLQQADDTGTDVLQKLAQLVHGKAGGGGPDRVPLKGIGNERLWRV